MCVCVCMYVRMYVCVCVHAFSTQCCIWCVHQVQNLGPSSIVMPHCPIALPFSLTSLFFSQFIPPLQIQFIFLSYLHFSATQLFAEYTNIAQSVYMLCVCQIPNILLVMMCKALGALVVPVCREMGMKYFHKKISAFCISYIQPSQINICLADFADACCKCTCYGNSLHPSPQICNHMKKRVFTGLSAVLLLCFSTIQGL